MFRLKILVFSALAIFTGVLTAQSREIVGVDQKFVLDYLQKNHASLGINANDAATARVADLYKDRQTGIVHAYVQQYLHGLPVINAVAGLHFNRYGQLVHSTSNFSASEGTVDVTMPELPVMVQSAAALTGLNIAATPVAVDPSVRREYLETEQYYYICWYAEPGMSPVKVMNLIVYDIKTGDWWNLLLDHQAKLLSKINWTATCSMHAAEGEPAVTRRGKESSQYNAFNFPVESPLYGSRSLMVSPADTAASPLGWHDINGTEGADYTTTRGNNVLASEDKDANNVAGYSPNGNSVLTFNQAFSMSEKEPLNYTDFAITNLFVANNLMHDITHWYGFDEESGNFQEFNYTGKGASSDGVNADAQDGSGTNNANFSTPPDGSNPRMQMYIWDATSAGGGPTLKMNSPGTEKFRLGRAQFGGSLSTVPITANLVLVNDGSSSPEKGCLALKNGSAINGKIAAVERGNCTFVQKVYNAQQAGAIAVVILDTSVLDQLITMSGTDSRITIPAVFAKFSDANGLMEALSSGTTNVSLYDSTGLMPKTDSDLDMMVIAHEYTHGISNRLTCGPSNTSALNNAEQMGEGWSDFVGLAFTVKSGDVGATPRGVGNWLLGENEAGPGIRNYPYSTNMAKNPLTYKSIIDASTTGNAEVHFVGEVWCAMLWDLYWKMVEKYGYNADLYRGTGGNNMAIRLVFDGMKLQKCNPGFVDGRNAILKADSILNGGANAKLIWEVFARRGLGFSAKQGLSTSTRDGSQAFDLPPIYSGSNATRLISQSAVSMRPNPAADLVYLEPANVMSLGNVTVLDLAGRTVSVPVQRMDGGSCRLNVAGLTSGTYIIRCATEIGDWTARLQVVN